VGAGVSDGEYILLLDADFTPRPDLLDERLPYMDAFPDTGIVPGPGRRRRCTSAATSAAVRRSPFPGLYDPAAACDVSPLLNAFEAARAIRSTCPMTDSFVLEMASDPEPGTHLRALAQICEMTRDPDIVRSALDDRSWSLPAVTLSAASMAALARSAAMAQPHSDGLGPAHQRILTAIRRHAGLGC
jgi:hypothetical protein